MESCNKSVVNNQRSAISDQDTGVGTGQLVAGNGGDDDYWMRWRAHQKWYDEELELEREARLQLRNQD